MKNTSEKLIEKSKEMMDLAFEEFDAGYMKNMSEKEFKILKISLELIDTAIEFQQKWVEHMEEQNDKLDKILRNQCFKEAKMDEILAKLSE